MNVRTKEQRQNVVPKPSRSLSSGSMDPNGSSAGQLALCDVESRASCMVQVESLEAKFTELRQLTLAQPEAFEVIEKPG